MLWHKAQGAGGAGGGIEYIGSVTKSADSDGDWNSSGEAPDVMSLASVGDLVVIAMSVDNYNAQGSPNWAGMSFTEAFFGTTAVESYVGYRFVQSGDANPYLSGYQQNVRGISSVLSVFSGVSSYVDSNNSFNDGGRPNPPSLTANGNLWIATGHIDDDVVTGWTLGGGYTIADNSSVTGQLGTSSTVLAYKIETLTSDDPPQFGSDPDPSDSNYGVTTAFD